MNSHQCSDSTNLEVTFPQPLSSESFDLLGLRLHAMTKHDLVDAAVKAADAGVQCIVGNHNLHSLYLWYHSPKMRAFYSLADYVHIDGTSLVWLGRLLGLPLRSKHRVTYLDLVPLLAEEAAKRGLRVVYLGSRPGVAEKGARTLAARYPGLRVFTLHGYFDTERLGKENQKVLAQIRDFAPDILMVGMGMPREQIWIVENLADIAAHSIFCSGAYMDYVVGEIPTPPRWLGPLCLEWLYRLFSEPARLWRRYLLEPWSIFFGVTRYYLRSGHWSITGKAIINAEISSPLPNDPDSTTPPRREEPACL